MDPNNNWPNNPSPTPPSGMPPAQPSTPFPTSQPEPTPPDVIPANPSTPPVPDATSWIPPAQQPVPPPNPTYPQTTDLPSATLPPSPSTWPPLPTTTPDPTASSSPFGSIPSATPNPDPLMSQNTDGSPSTNTSPLDNPWGAPPQAPAIDGSATLNPQPSSPWSTSNSPSAPLSSNPLESTPQVTDSAAPTDLSHLISNNLPAGGTGNELPPLTLDTPAANSAETLVVPPASTTTPDIPTVPTEGHKGIPKWLIGVGIGLLIIVAGASAYFILGVGQAPKTTSSIPAEVTNKPTVKTPPPIATPTPPSPAAVATGSANFGNLQGTPTASPKQATRAGDLLK